MERRLEKEPAIRELVQPLDAQYKGKEVWCVGFANKPLLKSKYSPIKAVDEK